MAKNKHCERLPESGRPMALTVMQIVAMSFAILAVVVFVTVSLTKWIVEISERAKYAKSKVARRERNKRNRIKHILRQRRLQKKSEKAKRKNQEFFPDDSNSHNSDASHFQCDDINSCCCHDSDDDADISDILLEEIGDMDSLF